MKRTTPMLMLAIMLSMAWLSLPGEVEAGCYKCDSLAGCMEACENASGKRACTHTMVCIYSGCYLESCSTSGQSCTGTAVCASCSDALEECGIDYADLVVPNGEVPPEGGSWFEMRDSGVKLCAAAPAVTAHSRSRFIEETET